MLEGHDLEQLHDCCTDAFGSSGHESFFSLLGWYQLVARHGLTAGHRAVLLWDAEVKCGLVCCHPPRSKELRSCTNMYTCDYGVLGQGDDAAAVRFLAKAVAQSREFNGVVRFEGLDPASPGFASLMDGFRAEGLLVKPYNGWGVWFEPTSGATFEEYLSKRPSVLRNTWQRKLAKLEQTSGATVQTNAHVPDPEAFISRYESVRARSWKAQEPFPAFIPNLIRFAARMGALRSGVVEINGVSAAAQFWLFWGGTMTIYKLVYAEEFSEFSPGTILTMEMMRSAMNEDRPREINFGRGDDAYKKLWLSSRRERWGLEAANPRTFRGFVEAVRFRASMARRNVKAWS